MEGIVLWQAHVYYDTIKSTANIHTTKPTGYDTKHNLLMRERDPVAFIYEASGGKPCAVNSQGGLNRYLGYTLQNLLDMIPSTTFSDY
jgi:hypothetical protein